MKKWMLMIAVTITGAALLTGCGEKVSLGEEFTEEVNALEGVSIVIQEDTISPTGFTYEIDNQSGQDLSYGQDYSVQKEKDGKWYTLEGNPIPVTLEMLWASAGSTNTHEVNWEAGYGKLKKGHYRLVKSLATEEAGYWFAAEFNIE